jgi:hypothetical protein
MKLGQSGLNLLSIGPAAKYDGICSECEARNWRNHGAWHWELERRKYSPAGVD